MSAREPTDTACLFVERDGETVDMEVTGTLGVCGRQGELLSARRLDGQPFDVDDLSRDEADEAHIAITDAYAKRCPFGEDDLDQDRDDILGASR